MADVLVYLHTGKGQMDLPDYVGGGGGDGNRSQSQRLSGLRVRFHIIRNACIETVFKYQSCMVSKLRIIWKQTVADDHQATQQADALRSWGRREFLRPECLAPGGLLYMTAMDSFGTLTADQLIIFPHFGRQILSRLSFFSFILQNLTQHLARAQKQEEKEEEP